MHYVISDIHGCFREFEALLEKIGFSDRDELYILGDCLDRGPSTVGVLERMSMHENIFPILGNHEYLFGKVAGGMLTEITEEAIPKVLSEEFLENWDAYRRNGGDATMKEFRSLPEEDREFYLDYLADFSLCETLQLKGKEYLLIHSLPDGFSGDQELSFVPEAFLFGRPDFFGNWNQETILITGHTPTVKLGPEYAGRIFHRGNFYDIDCGCVTGYRLGALCLETGEEFYTDSLGVYWKGKSKK